MKIEGLQEAADRLEVLALRMADGLLMEESLQAFRSFWQDARFEIGGDFEHRALRRIVQMVRAIDYTERGILWGQGLKGSLPEDPQAEEPSPAVEEEEE